MPRPKKAKPAGDFVLLGEDDTPIVGGPDAMLEYGEDEGDGAEKAAEVKHQNAPDVAVPEGFTVPAGQHHYFVRLHCPTPLAHPNGAHLAARNEQDAKAKFCELNGISDSQWEWKVEKIA